MRGCLLVPFSVCWGVLRAARPLHGGGIWVLGGTGHWAVGTERPVSLLGGCRGGVTVPCPHRFPLGASAMSLGGQETRPVLGGSRSAGERPGGARGGPGQPAAPAHPPGTNPRRHRGAGGCGDKWWLCQHRTRALGMEGQVTVPQGTPG